MKCVTIMLKGGSISLDNSSTVKVDVMEQIRVSFPTDSLIPAKALCLIGISSGSPSKIKS